MEILVEYALKRLNSYFAREVYNSGLTFINTSNEVDNIIILRTGCGEEIFSIPYHDVVMLEGFMIRVEAECHQLGDCLIITDSSEDAERINRLWCYDKCVDHNSSDERLPELSCK